MVTQQEINAAFNAARKSVNSTGYGHWVSDALLLQVVKESLEAASKVRK